MLSIIVLSDCQSNKTNSAVLQGWIGKEAVYGVGVQLALVYLSTWFGVHTMIKLSKEVFSQKVMLNTPCFTHHLWIQCAVCIKDSHWWICDIVNNLETGCKYPGIQMTNKYSKLSKEIWIAYCCRIFDHTRTLEIVLITGKKCCF